MATQSHRRKGISIHALVKRATLRHYYRNSRRGHFNPRPREEGDTTHGRKLTQEQNFNPRPREEGDTEGGLSESLSGYFNPRPREEGDAVSSM